MDRTAHWDAAYRDADDHSWDQRDAEVSRRLLLADEPPRSVLDVGGGASPLAAELVAAGVETVTVLDVSAVALEEAAARLGDAATRVEHVVADLLTWTPARTYDAWHDRAVFHFLTDAADRDAYRERLHAAVPSGGRVVVATFAPDGPERCSGLPVARYDGEALADELGLAPDGRHVEREVHRTPWGSEQAFTWLVGRRP